MSEKKEIRVPDIGDFKDVEVIEVLVSAGDTVAAEDALLTLETDKASMDVPAPFGGRIAELKVSTGDRVSEGDVIALVEAEEEGRAESAEGAEEDKVEKDGRGDKADKTEKAEKSERNKKEDASEVAAASSAASSASSEPQRDYDADLLVLGAGPGGYTAAFRAADLGRDVTLVERWDTLGGVCLNVGCIPSKALLHAAAVIEEAAHMSEHGIVFGAPKIELDKLRNWKGGVVGRLTKGLDTIAKQRKVKVLRGSAKFTGPHTIKLDGPDGGQELSFRQCIIAAGSESMALPDMPDDPRVMDSTGALALEELPQRMLVIGGGIIGLEMACVYDALGVKVSVVELTDTLMPGCDRDLVRPLEKRIKARYEAIMTGTKVTEMKALKSGIKVSFEGKNAPDKPVTYDRVLVAVGRRPNGEVIDGNAAGVMVERGFIPVDKQQRTNVEHIFAIGDIVGQPMLAHKATHEGKVAAEVACGEKSAFDARVIPSVAYTDPEIAWVGLTEDQAKAEGVEYEKGVFPWAASGRSLAIGREEGFTKLLFSPESGHLLGAGIVGTNAGDLISETALAIEMGCDAADIGLTVHPHPTLSESVAMAAEAFEGTLTDLYLPKKRAKKS
ncbi:dihydrolipoyl dehydrogenase [Wenzhouxiangella sp. XN24]|uniref:dihydrolipoyl dehydrogenase n=1 Tax=Wenzhouxiangella sp. XN24 TaxID=2713569 RepID=UPI0013EC2BF2|nr:dihydrolipoyl dehydrogenase [Wenzhouxiangella sp. XN24]NGX15597.1 dihydrolipoyl dehydrogenase [Wenzhouxiangella sp. XN24]